MLTIIIYILLICYGLYVHIKYQDEWAIPFVALMAVVLIVSVWDHYGSNYVTLTDQAAAFEAMVISGARLTAIVILIGGAAAATSDSDTFGGKLVDGASSGVAVLTTEVIARRLPGISGNDVSTFSKYFFDGAHTRRAVEVETVEVGISNEIDQAVDNTREMQNDDE